MPFDNKTISIVGAGLAGSECALQLADKGYDVVLFEMRSIKQTPAHKTANYAELVCSNSFGSFSRLSAPGQLKWEAELLSSHIIENAFKARVPAGQALGMDRELFAELVTQSIHQHPRITIVDKIIESLDEIPRPCVVATGPLTYEPLAESMRSHFGGEFLYFFDAIAPIVDADSIDFSKVWKGDRWDRGTGDYINCPMNKEQYYAFINEIKNAKRVEAKDFEINTPYFDGCMPIEEIIRRGDETLRFGPLSPKGLWDPRVKDERIKDFQHNDVQHNTDGLSHSEQHSQDLGTGNELTRKPYAVVQLRQDNKMATAFNIVGFQTKMAFSEQKRIFRMIPGLENAEFLKLGSIHRNLYLNSPKVLSSDLSSKHDPLLFFAGQITGVEGYFESACIGLLVANFIDSKIQNTTYEIPPKTTAFGALIRAITEPKEMFQPTNINFGLMPPSANRIHKSLKRTHHTERARRDFNLWLKDQKVTSKTEKFFDQIAAEILTEEDLEKLAHPPKLTIGTHHPDGPPPKIRA